MLLRSPVRSPLRSPIRHPLDDPFFSPALLLTGTDGSWYDPSDITTLFQDSTATTPVTATGDPVGYIGDKSGNGRHLIQATSGLRGTYRVSGNIHYIELAATQTLAAADYTAPLPLFMCAGVMVTTGAVANAFGVALNSTNYIRIAASTGTILRGDIRSTARGSVTSQSVLDSVPLNAARVASCSFTAGLGDIRIGVSGSFDSDANTWQASDTLVGSIRVGASADLAMNFYGGLIMERTPRMGERAELARFFAAKAGITV